MLNAHPASMPGKKVPSAHPGDYSQLGKDESPRVPERTIKLARQLCADQLELFFKLSFHKRSIKKQILSEILDYDDHLRKIAPGWLSFLTASQRDTVIELLRDFELFSQNEDELDIERVCRIFESSITND